MIESISSASRCRSMESSALMGRRSVAQVPVISCALSGGMVANLDDGKQNAGDEQCRAGGLEKVRKVNVRVHEFATDVNHDSAADRANHVEHAVTGGAVSLADDLAKERHLV